MRGACCRATRRAAASWSLDEGQELLLGLYLDPCDRGDPDTVVEETSHLLCLAWHAAHDRRVSRLTLELQGEVDRYAVARLQGRDGFGHFERFAWADWMDAETRGLYEAAHRAARRYCRRLTRRFPERRDTPALLSELRGFYRASPEQKLHAATRRGRCCLLPFRTGRAESRHRGSAKRQRQHRPRLDFRFDFVILGANRLRRWMRMALTRRQREIYDFIRDFVAENGYSPSLEEIGAHFNLSSVATVHKHVQHLVEKRFLRKAWNRSRSVEPVEPPTSGLVSLPLLGTVAAGMPIEAVEVAETIDVPARVSSRSAARASCCGCPATR